MLPKRAVPRLTCSCGVSAENIAASSSSDASTASSKKLRAIRSCASRSSEGPTPALIAIDTKVSYAAPRSVSTIQLCQLGIGATDCPL